MATYLKTLSDNGGNIILPKTRSSGVYMNDNSTLENKITSMNTLINDKANTNHIHTDVKTALPVFIETSPAVTTISDHLYSKIFSCTFGSTYVGYSAIFILREWRNIYSNSIFSLIVSNGSLIDKVGTLQLQLLSGTSVAQTQVLPSLSIYHTMPTVEIWLKTTQTYIAYELILLSERYKKDNDSAIITTNWYNNPQMQTDVPSGTVIPATFSSAPISSPSFTGTPTVAASTSYTSSYMRNIKFSTSNPSSLANGEVCLVYQ